MTNGKQLERINPPTMPDAGAVGYSQISITEHGRLAFVSGQVAWSRDGGEPPAELGAQTDLVLHNAGEALKALSAKPSQIAQLRLYVTDISDAAQAEVMPRLMRFLDGARPSITGVGVAGLASPGLMLEMEMVVSLPS